MVLSGFEKLIKTSRFNDLHNFISYLNFKNTQYIKTLNILMLISYKNDFPKKDFRNGLVKGIKIFLKKIKTKSANTLLNNKKLSQEEDKQKLSI